MTHTSEFLSGNTCLRFEALQNALVPRSKNFTPEQQARSRQLINTLLAQQDAKAQRQLKLFLVLIDLFSMATRFAYFRNLAEDKQSAVLKCFFDSPIPLIRKGFWGLNTLARLGVYSQTSIHSDIGYTLRPDPYSQSITCPTENEG